MSERKRRNCARRSIGGIQVEQLESRWVVNSDGLSNQWIEGRWTKRTKKLEKVIKFRLTQRRVYEKHQVNNDSIMIRGRKKREFRKFMSQKSK